MAIIALPVFIFYLVLAVLHLTQVKARGGLNVFEILLTFLFLGCLAIGTVIGIGFLSLSWPAGGIFLLGFIAIILACWLYVERFEARAATQDATPSAG